MGQYYLPRHFPFTTVSSLLEQSWMWKKPQTANPLVDLHHNRSVSSKLSTTMTLQAPRLQKSAVMVGFPLLTQLSFARHVPNRHKLEEDDWMLFNGDLVAYMTKAVEETSHEYITQMAMEQAMTDLAIVLKARNQLAEYQEKMQKEYSDNKGSLTDGARFNDLPSDEGLDPTACTTSISLADFSGEFATESHVVGKSHFGCRQYWHSMAPVSPGLYFKSSQIRNIIKHEIYEWWQSAVGGLNLHRSCSYFKVGRTLHTIQDSYAAGHVARTDDGGANCGDILMFQGYGNQDHDKHKQGDTSSLNVRAYECARDRSTQVLNLFIRCAIGYTVGEDGTSTIDPCSVTELESILDSIYTLHSGTENVVAGSSLVSFALKDKSNTGEVKKIGTKSFVVYAPSGSLFGGGFDVPCVDGTVDVIEKDVSNVKSTIVKKVDTLEKSVVDGAKSVSTRVVDGATSVAKEIVKVLEELNEDVLALS